MHAKKHTAFTVVEVLLTIVVLAIVSGFIAVKMTETRDRSDSVALQASADELNRGLDLLASANLFPPDSSKVESVLSFLCAEVSPDAARSLRIPERLFAPEKLRYTLVTDDEETPRLTWNGSRFEVSTSGYGFVLSQNGVLPGVTRVTQRQFDPITLWQNTDASSTPSDDSSYAIPDFAIDGPTTIPGPGTYSWVATGSGAVLTISDGVNEVTGSGRVSISRTISPGNSGNFFVRVFAQTDDGRRYEKNLPVSIEVPEISIEIVGPDTYSPGVSQTWTIKASGNAEMLQASWEDLGIIRSINNASSLDVSRSFSEGVSGDIALTAQAVLNGKVFSSSRIIKAEKAPSLVLDREATIVFVVSPGGSVSAGSGKITIPADTPYEFTVTADSDTFIYRVDGVSGAQPGGKTWTGSITLGENETKIITVQFARHVSFASSMRMISRAAPGEPVGSGLRENFGLESSDYLSKVESLYTSSAISESLYSQLKSVAWYLEDYNVSVHVPYGKLVKFKVNIPDISPNIEVHATVGRSSGRRPGLEEEVTPTFRIRYDVSYDGLDPIPLE